MTRNFCPNCQLTFSSRQERSLHIEECDPWNPPGVIPCLCSHRATSNSQMKRHKKSCSVWQNRDRIVVSAARRKATCQERYGGSSPMASAQVRSKIRETNLDRYGVENPFASEEVQEKIKTTMQDKYGVNHVGQSLDVQEKRKATNLERYGVENPFADPDVQAQIRQTMLDRHGVENPQQSASIRKKTRQTNLKRYGVEETLASPVVRTKIKATCQEKYGGNAPACSAEVQEKIKTTNQSRYGVDWTCQDESIRQAQLDTMFDNYGEHFFSSLEGKYAVVQGMLEKYGVSSPLHHPESLQKMLQNRSYESPNKLEQKVDSWSDRLYFTGDGQVLFYSDTYGKAKNPDFVVVPEDWDGDLTTLEITKCVEVFGDYWHGPEITGMSNEEHVAQVQALYDDLGIEVLILWECDINSDPEELILYLTDNLD